MTILELIPFFFGGQGRVVYCGMLAWEVGQRDSGSGLCPQARGCVPKPGAVSPHASSTAEAQHRQGRICSLSLVTLPAWECSG